MKQVGEQGMNDWGSPIQIADNVYWVGSDDASLKLRCNPYLVIENGRGVLIDGGSKSSFPNLMINILQVGLEPRKIDALIYQHYDPDLCGSMDNIVSFCKNPNIKIITASASREFVAHYMHTSRSGLIEGLSKDGTTFSLRGRALKFILTPHAHSFGSFVTYDEKTGTLFSSDLFGSMSRQWQLFRKLDSNCYTCNDYQICPDGKDYCPLPDIIEFHEHIMPCCKALRYALSKIRKLDVRMIAPQHGSIFSRKQDINFIIQKLASTPNIGIDGIVKTL